jgi:hypothetical protein
MEDGIINALTLATLLTTTMMPGMAFSVQECKTFTTPVSGELVGAVAKLRKCRSKPIAVSLREMAITAQDTTPYASRTNR